MCQELGDRFDVPVREPELAVAEISRQLRELTLDVETLALNTERARLVGRVRGPSPFPAGQPLEVSTELDLVGPGAGPGRLELAEVERQKPGVALICSPACRAR